MTTSSLILVLAPAVVVLYAIWVGIPLWMVLRRPDTAPDTRLPEYLRPDWENLPKENLARTVRRRRR
jgi:hypothetical protein